MAGSRVPIVVGILAVAGGITWFALRGDQGSSGLTPAPAPRSGSGAGRAAIFAPEGPTLEGPALGVNAFDPPPGPALPALVDAPPGIDAPSHRDVFDAQTRDPAWAARTEGELKERIRKLKLTTVLGVDCRTDQCELTLSGSPEAIDTTIATLEGAKGLSTLAKSLLLGGPEQSGEQMTLRVYALFDR